MAVGIARMRTRRACTYDGIGLTGAGDYRNSLKDDIRNQLICAAYDRSAHKRHFMRHSREFASPLKAEIGALALQSRVFRFRVHSALSGVFFAIDGRNVRWISVEIGSPDPKFLAVRVDPVPQGFA
jgi:hypothetical protein